MRALSLAIYGLLADLPSVTKGLIRLTQARAALAELSSRFGEFSWPITLPATRDNARIFGVGALHSLGLDKFRAVDYPFELRCEGEIFSGLFRLTSMRGGYTGNLIGAGSSWASEIGDKKLTELKLAPIRYDGSQLEAILAKNCDETDIQFPLLSFGNFFAPPQLATQRDGSQKEESLPAQALIDHPLSVDDYAPSVYLRNVLRQMFTDIGWSLTGRVLDEPHWRETVITPAGATLASAWPYGALLPARAEGSNTEAFSYFATGNGNAYTNSALGFDEDAPCGNIDGFDMGGECFFLPVPCPVTVSGGTRALDGSTATFIAPLAGVYGFAHSTELLSGHQNIFVPPLRFVTANERARFADVKLALLIRRGGESYDASPLNGAPVDPLTVPQFNALGPCFTQGGAQTGNIIPQTLTGSANGVYLETGDSVQLLIIGRRRLIDLPTDRLDIERREFVLRFGAVRFECTSFDGAQLLSPAAFLPPLAQRDVLRDFLLRTDSVAVADASRRVVSLLTREELSVTAGKPIDLTGLIDGEAVEYAPAAGAGVAAVVFSSAVNSAEPLLSGLSDAVRIVVGPGSTEQRIDSLFAPVAQRSYLIQQSASSSERASLPTMATADALAQPLAEVVQDTASQGARLLRFAGLDNVLTVPFQQRRVPLARAEWSGALRFDTETGAVATYYGRTVERLIRGHVAKAAACITPAQYRQLTPGRAVLIQGARYSVEVVSQFDIADEGSSTTIELIREV